MEDFNLKPCPFCGGTGQPDYAHSGNIHYIDENGTAKKTALLYNVRCDTCGCKTDKYEKLTMAIAAWQKRAGEET